MLHGFPTLPDIAPPFADPNADRLMGWYDATGSFFWYQSGTGISISAGSVALNANMDDLNATALSDPGADRMVFWDDSDGQFEHLVPNTGLSITGNNLDVSLSPFSTTNLAEGTNLYYTQARFDTAFALKTLDDLASTALSDPGADRIVFWDDSDSQFEHLVPGTGLAISVNDLNVSLSSFGLDDLANTSLSDPGADRIVFWDDAPTGEFAFLSVGTSLSLSGTSLNAIQGIRTADSPTFTGLNLSGLTATRLLATDGSKNLASVSNLASWVAGTSNQITVTDDTDGTITLSTPQNIATGSSPTFAGLTLTGLSGVLKAATGVVSGSAAMTDLASTSLADPGADRIVFWDDSDSQFEHLVPNTGLAISVNNLNVSLSGFALDDLANTDLADPGADKIVFWDDGSGQFAFLEPNDGLSITTTNLNVDVTSPIQISGGSVGLNLATTYAWTGAHTWGVDGTGVDIIFYGENAGDKFFWDQDGGTSSAGRLTLDGSSELVVEGKSAFGTSGTIGGAGGNAIIHAAQSFTPGIGATIIGFEFTPTLNGGIIPTIYGMKISPTTTGSFTSGLLTNAIDLAPQMTHTGGTMTELSGIRYVPTINGTGGTTSASKAIRIGTAVVSAGTLTSQYGVVFDGTWNSATNNWGIYTDSLLDHWLGLDNSEIYLGSSNDVSLLFNGSNLLLNFTAVTTTARLIMDGGFTANEDGDDSDTRAEGDTLTHMLFLDASAATENIALIATGAPNWQSMDRGLFLGDTSAAPSGSPTAGIFIWSESGAGKARGTSGTVTTWAPAEPHCPVCGKDFSHEWENERFGYLSICMSCLADELGDRPYIQRRKRAA